MTITLLNCVILGGPLKVLKSGTLRGTCMKASDRHTAVRLNIWPLKWSIRWIMTTRLIHGLWESFFTSLSMARHLLGVTTPARSLVATGLWILNSRMGFRMSARIWCWNCCSMTLISVCLWSKFSATLGSLLIRPNCTLTGRLKTRLTRMMKMRAVNMTRKRNQNTPTIRKRSRSPLKKIKHQEQRQMIMVLRTSRTPKMTLWRPVAPRLAIMWAMPRVEAIKNNRWLIRKIRTSATMSQLICVNRCEFSHLAQLDLQI